MNGVRMVAKGRASAAHCKLLTKQACKGQERKREREKDRKGMVVGVEKMMVTGRSATGELQTARGWGVVVLLAQSPRSL